MKIQCLFWFLAACWCTAPTYAETPPRCEVYAAPVTTGRLRAPALQEASGIAWSRAQPDVLWAHNDSGDGPFIFAFSAAGEHLGTWEVTNAGAVDWEDIAVGPCADGAPRCLYIADTGDNALRRADLAVYRVAEPDVALHPGPATAAIPTAAAERLPFRYPDGLYDCESFMAHPDGPLFWVTKVTSGDSFAFHWPSFDAPLPPEGIATLEPLGGRNFGRLPLFYQATTGADFAPDGSRFVVRSYQRAHVFDATTSGTPADQVREAFARTGEQVFMIPNEWQGEAVAFGPDSQTLWTTTEGAEPPLQRFDCVAAPPPPDEDTGAPSPDIAPTEADTATASEDVSTPADDDASPSADDPSATLDDDATLAAEQAPASCRCGQGLRARRALVRSALAALLAGVVVAFGALSRPASRRPG